MYYFFFFFNDTATTEIYTLSLQTLFRSHSVSICRISRGLLAPRAARRPISFSRRAARARSAEHTSELQSQSNIVCRLLLEKKNIHPSESHYLRKALS